MFSPPDFRDRRWSAPVRELAGSIRAVVLAAQRQDRAIFAEALTATEALDPEQVALVLGSVVQLLLEETHPDGFGADDLQDLLEECARRTATWTAEPHLDVLVFVLSGALGVQDPEEAPAVAHPRSITAHASLVVAELLMITRRSPTDYLVLVLDEIARDQTMELP